MARQSTGLRWEPRVPDNLIRRLYETDARGIRDEMLLDEVAYALYSRCESILTVTEAVHGRVKCPRCGAICDRLRAASRKPREDRLRCPDCAWETTWGDYRRSYENKGNNILEAAETSSEEARWSLLKPSAWRSPAS